MRKEIHHAGVGKGILYHSYHGFDWLIRMAKNRSHFNKRASRFCNTLHINALSFCVYRPMAAKVYAHRIHPILSLELVSKENTGNRKNPCKGVSESVQNHVQLVLKILFTNLHQGVCGWKRWYYPRIAET